MIVLDKIRELISQMTFEEKAIITSGISTMGVSGVKRFGIDEVTLADGPHGVRIMGTDDCVSFPCLSAVAATWNKNLAYKMGEGIAKDCITHDRAMILGPGVNLKRTDLCGRNFEYFSEDPVLSGEMAAGYINGVQSLGVGACIKHFAVNNQETDRLTISVDIDERTLRELYLRPFEIAVKKSNPASVMCALQRVNSVLCSENKFLLNDILKEEWGYAGFTMTDWGCCKDKAKALKAGLDLQMPDAEGLVEKVREALENGTITNEILDEAVYRILKFVANYKKQNVEVNRDVQHSLAREIAEESIVLLKNENNMLPITKGKYKKIAILGEYAEKPVISGYGSANVYVSEKYIDNPLECLKEQIGGETEIAYVPLFSTDKYFESTHIGLQKEYAKAIDGADLVLMFIGRQKSVETEGSDRVTSHLDPYYEFFINRIYAKKKDIVLVVQSGGAFIPLAWQNKVKGIVQMWLGGEGAGSAIANVLCGKVNPSGKLSETFPLKSRTDIDYPGNGYCVSYDEKWRIGYRYYDLHPDEVWYPFGYGLSYTTFEYSDMKISGDGDEFKITLKVKNTGSLDGKEAVQIYVSDTVSSVSKPVKELCGFEKVFLCAGEEKEVTVTVPKYFLAHYNLTNRKWMIEPGEFVFYAAASAQDIKLQVKYFYSCECDYTFEYETEQIIG